MKKLCIICEGKTEVHLVYNLLYDRLSKTYSDIIPITLPTGRNPIGGTAKGGFRRYGGYAYALTHIQNTIKLHKSSVLTTFFDLFNFPNDIGCYKDAERISDPILKAVKYEQQMDSDIRYVLGEEITFLPHVQPYESEAFLFVDPLVSALEMGELEQDVEQYKHRIEDIRHSYLTPEHINAAKGPSRHLEEIFPNYRKNKVGKSGFSWRVAKEIGINAIIDECEHFGEWIFKLESYRQ